VSAPELLWIAMPVADAPLEPRLRAAEQGFFWDTSELSIAGVGVAAKVESRGADRFSELRDRAEALLARVQPVAGEAGGPAPRLFGGFSFHARQPRAPWLDFGQARFVLPRIAHVRERGRSWLCLALGASVRERGRARADEPADRPADPSSEPSFVRAVQAILTGIEQARFEKVVAARSAVLETRVKLDAATVLERLARRSAGAARFAFVERGASFVGATPERLIEKRGLVARSEALAGSARPGDRALLDSDKERAEHAIVRDEIVRRLEPVASLEHPEQPDVRVLRHVAHLWTPIRAELSRPLHVLDLVERLHPTPAVGGHPRSAALAWLEREERLERGWYAGPIGWFDARGDGDFRVALRAGLFAGGRAHLFAGAGIVRGSDPERELAETELKLATLREVVEAA
jgi:isochorismate synthase